MQPTLRHIPYFRPVKKNDFQDIRLQMAPVYIRKHPTENKRNSYFLVLIAFICCCLGYFVCSITEAKGLRGNN
jgi:hypothetical protein